MSQTGVDVTVVVAGEAGQGVQSAGNILAKLFFRAGYYVFAYPDIMSRIRGGHNFTRIRVSDRPVGSVSGRMNVLLALDDFSSRAHLDEMVEGGVVLTESGEKGVGVQSVDQVQLVMLPMWELARKYGNSKALSGAVALGAMVKLVGQSMQALESILSEEFSRKGKQVVGQNIACARQGFEAVSGEMAKECPCRIPILRNDSVSKKVFLTGNQASGFGALVAGVKFYAGYPMSPSTGIMEFLASKQKDFRLVVEQAEDEVAAVNMVLGASYAGAKAMTATSGGGFALMVEALGLAGMAELPMVIVLCQRPGPATGFPTRTEQAELLYVLNASQDEFPRFVFAPGDALQIMRCTMRAVDLAWRFQVPAIVLSDQFLADSFWTLEGWEEVCRDALEHRQKQVFTYSPYDYKRYRLTPDGVSPRLFPGVKQQLVCSSGSEHGEDGLPTEDAEVRSMMQEKRMRKITEMSRVFGNLTCCPSETENCIVVCYGSTLGVVKESVQELRRRGADIGFVHLHEIWPVPRDRLLARLTRARQIVTVEHNATGQMARLLRRETRLTAGQILKYDGRPFSVDELVVKLGEMYRGRL